MSQALFVQVARGGQLVAQHQFDLGKKVVKIGRSPTAQIRVEDPAASRVHAVLEVSPTGVTLVDLGTAAGTLVNGARVNRVSLSNGDQITIGETTLFIGLADAPQVVAAPVAGASPYAPQGPRPSQPSYQAPPSRPAPAPFQRPPTRPGPSPFQPPPTTAPGSYAMPGSYATPAPSSVSPTPPAAAAVPNFVAPEVAAASDALPDNDPIMTRMHQARRQRLFIGGGVVLVVAAVVVFMAIFQAPRQIPGADAAKEAANQERKAAAGDPGPAAPGGGDQTVIAAQAGDVARAAGDPVAPAMVPFDGKVPRDETDYLYRRLVKPESLEALAAELYGVPSRLRLLVDANPGIKSPSESIAQGVEIRVPRFAEYQVKSGDTLGQIAATELGAEDAYKRILEANGGVLASPETLEVGMKLKIPVLKPAP